MKIQLTRPLVFFDLETTGVNIAKDRIVELSYYKVFPNGTKEGKTYRVRPTIIDALGLETTMHIPSFIIAGTWKQMLLPPPVGSSARTSFPASAWEIISSCFGRKAS